MTNDIHKGTSSFMEICPGKYQNHGNSKRFYLQVMKKHTNLNLFEYLKANVMLVIPPDLANQEHRSQFSFEAALHFVII